MRQPLLREEHIVVGLCAVSGEEAIQKLIAALPAWRIDQPTKERICKLLVTRDRIGTTAIGRGISLPHCFSQDVEEPLIVFGVSAEGIPFSSLDGRPVHFIFMLILPQNESAEKMKRDILQNIKWFLCDRGLQDRLKAVHSPQEVFALLSQNAVTEPEFVKAA